MIGYLLRRLVQSLLVLIIVLVLVYFLVNAVGDPARLMLPDNAPHSVYLALRHRLGLDDPFFVRFLRTLKAWSHGSFGDSIWQGVPALPLAVGQLPALLLLAGATMAIALPSALTLGILSGSRRGSTPDRLATGSSLFGVSVPDFWLGLMLILLFAVHFRIFPTSGYGDVSHLVLPALTLAPAVMGRLTQITSSAVAEELTKPYAVAAEAKGLSSTRVLVTHVLKNASLPIITLAGSELATLLNGSVVIGIVFAWPGLGTLFIQAIERRDLPLVEACVFVVAIFVIVVNLLVDLSYGILDPRTNGRN